MSKPPRDNDTDGSEPRRDAPEEPGKITRRRQITRRIWRGIFRRARVYLPLALVLLVAMALFLPISGRWLADWAEKEAGRLLDMEVSAGKVQVILSEARAEVFQLRVGTVDPTLPPFTIQYLGLFGTVPGLLAGDDAWPEEVVVESPSALRFSRDEENRWRLEGAPRVMIENIVAEVQRRDAARRAEEEAGTPRARSANAGRTPKITVTNVRVEVAKPAEDLPPLNFFFNEIQVLSRPSGDAPVRAEIVGLVVGDRTEEIVLRGAWFPEERRLSVRGSLSGGSLPFFVPRFGEFQGRASKMELKLDAMLERDGVMRGVLTLDADDFDVKQLAFGGERWVDRNIQIRVHAEYTPTENRLVLSEVAITGRNIDIAGSLEVEFEDGLPGEGLLSIQRLPPAALALGRNELLEQLGVRLTEQATTSTMRLEASVRGPIADLANLDSEVQLRMRGWMVDAPQLPEPVDVQRLNLFVSRDLIDLREFAFGFGGIQGRATARLPVLTMEGSGETGTVHLEATGRAALAYDLLRRYGLGVHALSEFDAPVQLDAQLNLDLHADPATGQVRVAPLLAGCQVALSWGEGRARLRRTLDDIVLGRGRINVREGEARIDRLDVGLRDLRVVAEGLVTGGPLNMETEVPLAWDGRVQISGSIAEVLEHIGRETELGRLPEQLAGRFALDFDGSGSTEIDEIDYRARLTLDGASGVIPIPNTNIYIREATATIDATPERVVLRGARFKARAGDEPSDADAVLNFELDEDRARVETNVRTRFEFLTASLPHELNDLLMIGELPAAGWGEIRPGFELPAGRNVVLRWIKYLQRPGLRIGYQAPADLIADFRLDYQQASPVEVTPREFPTRLENIRGNVHFDPAGIHIRSAMADAGGIRGLFVREAEVILGRRGEPTVVNVQLEADHLDLNVWTEGWGEQPWAIPSHSFIPGWTRNMVPQKFVEVNLQTRIRGGTFMTYTAQETSASVSFEGWSRRNPRLYVRDLSSQLYDGTGTGTLEFEFPPREYPILSAWVDLDRINLKPFMDDLMEREQTMDGYLFGSAEFTGQLLNYPTYRGSATYEILRSSFARNVVPFYVQGMLDLTTRPGSYDSELKGTINMYDQMVFLPDFVLVSPVVYGTADGYVDYRGRLNFDVTASFISHQLRGIPFVGGEVSRLVDFVGRNVVSYELRGTVNEPATRTVPTITRQLAPLTRIFTDSRNKILPGRDE